MRIAEHIKTTGMSIERISEITKQIDPSGKGISTRTIYGWLDDSHEARHSKLELLVQALNSLKRKKKIKLADIL